MKTENPEKENIVDYNTNLLRYIEANYNLVKTLYLDLGVCKVRLLCYSELFIPHIEKQLGYTAREYIDKYDTTIVLWNEPSINSTVSSYDSDTKTYFYGVKNLEPEEFIKEGHLLVKILYQILKTENTNLIHGACVGLNNNGVLFCARGQRGKSTLTVLSMIEGFEYVSDDYLTLEKDGNNLYAHPIYSIITLSPRMYNELYDRLGGTRFVSNNARKDKYVLNIANFHNQFKTKYPIKLCMFPEITSDPDPLITECSIQEKGRAITHLVHSTILQMQDFENYSSSKKLINMVQNFKFYKINLCNDIYRNVECLKKFMKEYKND